MTSVDAGGCAATRQSERSEHERREGTKRIGHDLFPQLPVPPVLWLPLLHEAQREEAEDAEEDGDRVRRVGGRHADAGRGPEGGSRRGPMDTASDVENRAAANESHSGEQPLKNTRLRVRATRESDLRDRDIPRRSDGDERERAKPGAAILVLRSHATGSASAYATANLRIRSTIGGTAAS